MESVQAANIDRDKKIKRFCSIFAEKSDWKIHSGKWKRLEAHLAFEGVAEMNPTVLELYGNCEPRLLLSLSHPTMLHLTHLDLRNNKITNLQGISGCKMPNLIEILLGDNFLLCVRDLRKLVAPNLSYLSLYANRINSLKWLDEAHFPKLKTLILGLNCISDFRTLNRCEWPHLAKISIENNRKCAHTHGLAKFDCVDIYG